MIVSEIVYLRHTMCSSIWYWLHLHRYLHLHQRSPLFLFCFFVFVFNATIQWSPLCECPGWFKHILFITENKKGLGRTTKLYLTLYRTQFGVNNTDTLLLDYLDLLNEFDHVDGVGTTLINFPSNHICIQGSVCFYYKIILKNSSIGQSHEVSYLQGNMAVFKMKNGVSQGHILSPLLFSFYRWSGWYFEICILWILVSAKKKEYFNHIAYTDDVV